MRRLSLPSLFVCAGLTLFALPVFASIQSEASERQARPSSAETPSTHYAQARRKADWKAPAKAKAAPQTAAKPDFVTPTPEPAPTTTTVPAMPAAPDTSSVLRSTILDELTSSPVAAPSPASARPVDESEELLGVDKQFALAIATGGPKTAYAALLSTEGILHDANGSSPPGPTAAEARFGTFPADVTLERVPESALASGGSGSSWGSYVIRRGDNKLNIGRYVTVWRLEAGVWHLVSELAAGRAPAGAQASSGGVLPRRPPSAVPIPTAKAGS